MGMIKITHCDQERCVPEMPKIDIRMDSYTYQMRPQNYLKVGQTSDMVVVYEEDEISEEISFFCTLRIFPTLKKQWILGTPFLADFYQVYDLRRNQIGLVPSAYVNNDPELK